MADGKMPAALPNALSLVEIERKGRALVASQPLKGGQVVLRSSPILSYSPKPLKRRGDEGGSSYKRYCLQCFKSVVPPGPGSTTLACPSCAHESDEAVFCSAKCQSLAIGLTHTPWVCQALRYLRNCHVLVDQQPDDRQVQARFLVAAYNLAMYSSPAFDTLLSLDGSHYQNHERDSATFLHSIISKLPFPQGMAGPTEMMTASLLSKDRCNTFGLMEPFLEHVERAVRVYAIYPDASYFNHDCLPNACRFEYLDNGNDVNTDMFIRMIHDVPQGQEVCLSYFPVDWRYRERQKRLLESYDFACNCDRCKVESTWPHDDDDDDDDGEDEAMEDDDGNMPASDEEINEIDGETNEIEAEENDDDFPHAYFFVKFMCDRENCKGTLAPLPPSDSNPPDIMECSVCGNMKRGD